MAHDTLHQSKFSRPQRLHERGSAERQEVNAILDSAILAHIGYAVDGRPVVTPTAYWREGDHLYWHGSSASRMMRLQASGTDVCVTVSLMDDLVLARSAFHHSVNYRSVMLFGKTTAIIDPVEKAELLGRFIDHLYPNRNALLRPMKSQELKATTLIQFPIEEGAAKSRRGMPVDDEEDMSQAVWAGLARLTSHIKELIPDPHTTLHPQQEPTLFKVLCHDKSQVKS
jgi:nitroimidazol reductase NimA-like FMN-containing flavoprotein (pyridoxamine 5'-phosphate oxidase superfamily)